jgi:hypothetical protein
MRSIILKDKRGIMKIIESFIAVMLILTAVLIIISRQKAVVSNEDEIVKLQSQILNYISVDETLRSQILVNNLSGVNSLIESTVPVWMNYSANICEASLICSNPAAQAGVIKKQVYANEILITANRTYYPGNATRLVIFFWEKE